MATYAVSDIHGCYDELLSVLSTSGFSMQNDTLYVLGDLFDRGPKVQEVAEWFLEAPDNIKFLRGNHDELLLSSCHGYSIFSDPHWAQNGGDVTILALNRLDENKRIAVIDKLKSLPTLIHTTVADNEFVLVHAGLMPPFLSGTRESWLSQSEHDLMWIRDEWLCDDAVPPFTVVFGHTPVKNILRRNCSTAEPQRKDRILRWNNKVAIDCGCCYGYSMGMIRLDDGAEFYCDAFSKTKRNYIQRFYPDYGEWDKILEEELSKPKNQQDCYLIGDIFDGWETFSDRIPELSMDKLEEYERVWHSQWAE